jgi:hypothetical protein
MGFQYRRRVKLLPGISLNVTQNGIASITLGQKGVRLNINRRGVKATVGVPGTGVYYTTKRKGFGITKTTNVNQPNQKLS